MKWCRLHAAAVARPATTAATKMAIEKLLERGRFINVVSFLSNRALPVGAPLNPPVTEQARKRKAPESQSQSGIASSAHVGVGPGPSSHASGSAVRELSHKAMAELEAKDRELQATRDEKVAKLKLELQDGDAARLREQLRLEKRNKRTSRSLTQHALHIRHRLPGSARSTTPRSGLSSSSARRGTPRL